MSFFGLFLSAVPKLFWSEYSGKPFFNCIGCKVPLLESNMHSVKKRIVGGEAVIEMAMCVNCQKKQVEQMSEETRENVTAFVKESFQKQLSKNLPEATADGDNIIRIQEIEDPEEGQALLDRCTNHCVVCGIERSKCHRYSLDGTCQESQLIVQVTPIGQTPLMICDGCEQQMAELISQKTRDSWDRFMEEHFDGPPGVEIDSPDHYPMTF